MVSIERTRPASCNWTSFVRALLQGRRRARHDVHRETEASRGEGYRSLRAKQNKEMQEQHDHQRICIKRRSPEPNNTDTSVTDAATSPVRTYCRRPCQVTRAYLYLLSDISLAKTGLATLGTAMRLEVPPLLRPTTARRVFSNRDPIVRRANERGRSR